MKSASLCQKLHIYEIGWTALNEKNIRRIIFVGFITTIILLILVIFFGDATKGAKRWINISGFSIQPSEFLKPFYTCFIALRFYNSIIVFL